MADVMLSYSHVDRARVRPIVEMLEDEGWDVWWDRGIEPGVAWEPVLEEVLAESRAVLVAWSTASAESEWVHREARYGLRRNGLVQVMIDPDSVPEEFAQFQAPDFADWQERRHTTEVDALLRRLNSVAPPSQRDRARPGYDQGFLGSEVAVGMPGIRGTAAIYRYLHFTVVMNPGRRMAHYVAYNVDGRAFVALPRRRDMPWAPDPLLPQGLQLEMAHTRRSDYHRGHLISPVSLSWGNDRDARIAARHAYFWTNVTPQTREVNTGSWLGIENWERNAATSYGRAIGFSGPVLKDADPPFRGRTELEDGVVAEDTFHIPQAYWKVVVVSPSHGELAVASFLVRQDQGAPGKQVRPYAVDLETLAEISEIHFPEELTTARSLALD